MKLALWVFEWVVRSLLFFGLFGFCIVFPGAALAAEFGQDFAAAWLAICLLMFVWVANWPDGHWKTALKIGDEE